MPFLFLIPMQWTHTLELLRPLATMFSAVCWPRGQMHMHFDRCLPLESYVMPVSLSLLPSAFWILRMSQHQLKLLPTLWHLINS